MVNRFKCLQFLADVIGDALVVIWGSAEKEWYHIRPNPPYLTSSFGFATSTGFGLALALPHRQVIVIDTDGGLLLNLGSLATLGNFRPPNLKVFVMDNECYESIGGMPTATAGRVDLAAIAKGAGIEKVETARTLDEFKEVTKRAVADNALHFIVAKIEKGTGKKLMPCFIDGTGIKYNFVRYIEKTEKINIILAPLQAMPK